MYVCLCQGCPETFKGLDLLGFEKTKNLKRDNFTFSSQYFYKSKSVNLFEFGVAIVTFIIYVYVIIFM